MMRKQEQLVKRLLQATEQMVQGGLSQTSRRCGNPNCICQRDPKRLHGPHLYITYRMDGKSRSLYVPPEHAKTARRAQQAWAAFWKIGCSLAALNREQLRRQWQQEKKARTAVPRRSVPRD
jgi:uncharacterized protein DUF6788